MENKEENLFVYGTLTDPTVQKKVFGRIIDGVADALIGYLKSTAVINRKEYPAIIPDDRNFVEGLVIAVTPEELKLIDEYETLAYKRAQIQLKSGTIAWAYVKN